MQRFQQTRHALGSTAYLTLVCGEEIHSSALFDTLWQQIEAFERRFSRFLQDSELSRFNLSAGSKQQISDPFRMLLLTAKHMAKKTGGLYNPFVLPALQRAGYKGSWPQVHVVPPQLDYADRTLANGQDITIGKTWAKIPPHTALDFGGIGKGYLLDQLAETLSTEGVTDYWLSLGGDILCAGHDITGDPWYVTIQHALQEGTSVGSVKNIGGKLAIATSGTTKRQGISDSGQWHHIIDPRTGGPAKTNILTATVCTTSATTADVIAKCLVIVGNAEAETTLHTMGERNALLQITDKHTVKVTQWGDIWLP